MTCLAAAALRGEGRDASCARKQSTIRPTTSSRTCYRPRSTGRAAGYGPSAIHRRSWIFMEGLCWRGSRRRRAGCSPEGEEERWTSISRSAQALTDSPMVAVRCVSGCTRSVRTGPSASWSIIVTGNYWAEELGSGKTSKRWHRPTATWRRPVRAYDDWPRAGGGRAGGWTRVLRVAAGSRSVLRAPVPRRARARLGRRQSTGQETTLTRPSKHVGRVGPRMLEASGALGRR
jgi:hypothetical protein